jgi:predicted aspartyl protease
VFTISWPLALLLSLALQAETPESIVQPASASAEAPAIPYVPIPPVELDTIDVTADEPRFVAPTRRDRIGRIWAPVSINGEGPFRLVLDTGASHSALTARVAARLNIPTDPKHTALLRGATGSVRVPMVPVQSLEVGDLLIEPRRLPIVPDALGGAEGILGTDGLNDKRIHIDFRNDSITIRRSRNEVALPGFTTIQVKFMRGRLLVADAWLGGVRTKAIIDTGGQATLGNEALRLALAERRRKQQQAAMPDEVTGATLDIQTGNRIATPSITIGEIRVFNPAMTFADFAIFEHWKLTEEPAMLIGMDVLGLLDTLIIDYRRKELQIRLRRS